jgi:hypothetical protein
MGRHGGGAPKLIYGHGRSPEGLRFKGGNSKRKVVRICFSCPMKKNELG